MYFAPLSTGMPMLTSGLPPTAAVASSPGTGILLMRASGQDPRGGCRSASRQSPTVAAQSDSSSCQASFGPSQIPVRRHGDQQLVRDGSVYLELGVRLQVFPHCRLRVVARPPRAVGEHVRGHVLDDSVEHHAVAAHGGERRVSFEFGEYVVVCVVAIEADQHTRMVRGDGANLFDDLWCDAG